jgi:hypothetical protein
VLEQHPALETLERFAAGQAFDDEAKKVVAHLLRRCPVCAAIISRSLQPLFDEEALPRDSGRARKDQHRLIRTDTDPNG